MSLFMSGYIFYLCTVYGRVVELPSRMQESPASKPSNPGEATAMLVNLASEIEPGQDF